MYTSTKGTVLDLAFAYFYKENYTPFVIFHILKWLNI